MQESSKRLLSLLFAVILLLLSLYLFGSYVRPALDEVRQERQALTLLRERLTAQKEAKSTVNTLLGELQDAQSVQGLLAMALPISDGVVDSVHQVQSLAKFNGLALQTFSVERLEPGLGKEGTLIKKAGQMRIEAELAGPYDNFRRFLAALETNIRLMDIEEFEINGSEGEILNYSLIIKAYYQ